MELRIGGIDFAKYKDLFFAINYYPEYKDKMKNGCIKYKDNLYILTEDVQDCDVICDVRAIEFYTKKNTWHIKDMVNDDDFSKYVTKNLLDFNLDSFLVDTEINYNRVKNLTTERPVDLNKYD